jgi:hypothetical protein
METSWPHQLEQWHDFFLLCGTAAVTLTGALFIVISLGPSIIAAQNNTGVKAFISPNAVYFTSVLIVSHVLLAPTVARTTTGWLLCAGALLSMLYLWSTQAPRHWRANGLSTLDWIWYIALPYLAYVLVLAAGIEVLGDDGLAMPAVAAAMLSLLIVGLRNAWDLAVWMPQQERNPDPRIVPGAAAAATPQSNSTPAAGT